jgi:3-hydroxyisobutyrate dehydrogenase/putative dehydrogenase
MVMSGAQAEAVILGEDGLVRGLRPGAAVLLTATIKPAEARALGQALAGSGIALIDSPVSGGAAGAQAGTLTMMAAGPAAALEAFRPLMAAVGRDIYHVGSEPGMGQTVKACLQSLIGGVYSATFEAAAMAAKAGIDGQLLHDVFTTSAAGSRIVDTSLQAIVERRFSGTGSHINTMHKDLTIALELARELGVPLFTAAAAMQWFQAGRARYPDGDNQAVARLIEELVGAELTGAGR